MSSDETLPGGSAPGTRWPGATEQPTDVLQPGQGPGTGVRQPSPGYPLGGYAPPAEAKTEVISKAPRVLAWLALVNGPRAGRLFTLSPEGTSLGRDAQSNDVILDDNKVSRQHAKIRIEPNPVGQQQFYLIDLASSNGTLLNGQPVTKEALYDGDRIQIGDSVLVFKQVDGPQRLMPEG